MLGVGLLVVGAERESENYRAVLKYSIPTIFGFVATPSAASPRMRHEWSPGSSAS
jgi:hypothetical protein